MPKSKLIVFAIISVIGVVGAVGCSAMVHVLASMSAPESEIALRAKAAQPRSSLRLWEPGGLLLRCMM